MSGGSKQQTSSNTQNYDQRQVNTWTSNAYDLSNRSTNTTNADFSNRSTTSNTTNTTTNADFSNRSTTNNTTDTTTNLWSDTSNRSTNTTNADFSNRSSTSTWTDSSNRSTNNTTINNTTTDGGAVAGALALGGAAVQQAGSQLAGVLGFASKVVDGQNASVAQSYDYADHLFNHALDTVHDSESAAMDAFDRAAQVQASTINQLQGAYADAKGTSDAQQKIIFVVLAVAGLAVMARR
ncbi:hypothetical protein HAV22_21340 [Massilia sp. TW-1]|uniref:Uncharacterized protein n=1 Tax=Telluria antibiotica TaxID=2717319 RepID=A0ABX0PFK5_9BURK|nr:hypothetical protein [Telluria antibiotica]NIA56181.1 hypothetical protein [Telluria antibiotica]